MSRRAENAFLGGSWANHVVNDDGDDDEEEDDEEDG